MIRRNEAYKADPSETDRLTPTTTRLRKTSQLLAWWHLDSAVVALLSLPELIPPPTPHHEQVSGVGMGLLGAVMGSSFPMEWDEWDCDCGGQSPPVFDLPPPPPPPELFSEMLNASPSPHPVPSDYPPSEDCPLLWTCPALLGARGERAPSPSRLPVTLVVATAISLVILVIIIAAVVYRCVVAAVVYRCVVAVVVYRCVVAVVVYRCVVAVVVYRCVVAVVYRCVVAAVVYRCVVAAVVYRCVVAAVVYRFRINRCRSAKNCTEMNGGIVYEDLPSVPSLRITPRGRLGPRYKPPLLHQHQLRHQLAERSLHVYTPEPHQLATSGHHRYHSISSGGTETCSCSISETPSCALLPHAPSPETSPAPRPLLSSDDDTPTPSPYHYYAGQRRPSNSTLYESLYYTGSASSSRSSNSQPRALPPLPSRSDRFRIYFSNDRRGALGGASRGSTRRQPQRPSHGAVFVAPPPPEIEPLYENM
ncbi:hypothetical protein FHG87_003630 [Trinorchestia longiramus]|nr:hypothetical protein FHG87_003630 [Trinorchestia longiramus]